MSPSFFVSNNNTKISTSFILFLDKKTNQKSKLLHVVVIIARRIESANLEGELKSNDTYIVHVHPEASFILFRLCFIPSPIT